MLQVGGLGMTWKGRRDEFQGVDDVGRGDKQDDPDHEPWEEAANTSAAAA